MKKPRTGKFINCLHCSKEFYIPFHRVAIAKYCSRACVALHARIQIKTACLFCKKEFTYISSRCNKTKYCSRLCYHRSQKEYKCANCGKKFMGSPSKHYKFCTPKCRGEYQRAPDTYATFAHVRKAWIRRGWIQACEKCGYDEVKEILGLHHKDENRKNNKRENLMVVCPMCHSLIHRQHIPH